MKGRLLIVLILVALLLTGIMPSNQAQAASCTWHVVKRGQNLTQIGRYYGVSVTAIVRANGIANPSRIYTGQRLCIPKSSPPPPPPDCVKIHIVKRGEYLKIIAARYGTSVTAIVRANGISNPNRIYVGQRLKIPVPCPKPKPTPKPPVTKVWHGQYWANRDLAGKPKFTRNVNAIDMNWGNGAPAGMGRNDNWSVRWTRTMYFNGGSYLFYLKSQDGVRLLVDGQMLINDWRDHDHPVNHQVEKQLSRGNHKLQVDYFNGHGPAQVHLQIEPIVGPIPPKPKPEKGPWKGSYWNNKQLKGAPVWTTTYRDVVFDWGKGSPKPGISADYFSAKYTGDFHFKDGKYRFYATVDDGVKIWVDDTLIMDEWRVQARTTFVSDVDIPEGNHRIKIIFFENTGAAVLKVFWAKR
jgi:LysM repeat protein